MEAFFNKYFGTKGKAKQTFLNLSHATQEDFDTFMESEVAKNAGRELKEKVDGYIDHRFKENISNDVLQFMIGSPDVQASVDQLKQNLGVLTDETFDVFKERLNAHLNETLVGNNILARIYKKIDTDMVSLSDKIDNECVDEIDTLKKRVTALEIQNNDLREDVNFAYNLGTISLGLLCIYPLFSGFTSHISF